MGPFDLHLFGSGTSLVVGIRQWIRHPSTLGSRLLGLILGDNLNTNRVTLEEFIAI